MMPALLLPSSWQAWPMALVHAAGPGHGKVVVSSYVMANNQTMRRGIILAFLSAFVQGTVAIVLVGGMAYLFNATGASIKQFGLKLTQLSYIFIILLGLYLLVSMAYRRYKNRKSCKNRTQLFLRPAP